MNFKKMLSLTLALSLATTTLILNKEPAYAEGTFASPDALIEDVLEVSLVGVTSSTMAAAKTEAANKITILNDVVSYDGSAIGYWYADDSANIYTDASKTATVIKETVEGYQIDPDFLYTILTDVNQDLLENYVPTSDDWSKIIGKYDVTLGDVTIPADQWITQDSYVWGNEYWLNSNFASSAMKLNLSGISGIDGNNISEQYGDNSIYMLSWLIDDSGELYLQSGLMSLFKGYNTSDEAQWQYTTDNLSTGPITGTARGSYLMSGTPRIQVGLVSTTSVNDTCANRDNTKTRLSVFVYPTNAALSTYAAMCPSQIYSDGESFVLRSISDTALKNECLIEDAKAYGIVYFTGAQITTPDITNMHAWHLGMFDSVECSKQTIGNTLLSKRLMKLATLASTDTLTVSTSGWFINDTTDIDTYMGQQQMTLAGDTTDIDAVAEIEPLCFNVVVPTVLPIYVSVDGTVSTASNATVVNKSNAAVKITDVDIEAKEESGWTLVDSTPSDVRDAKEFTFTTSLAVDTVLARDEVLPFTYDAELSPMTAGVDSLDLATVFLTVDWADA